jgi:nicotinamide-nucleotide amidase
VIATAFGEARGQADLVVATGGLGPTHDDVTREGLADALGERLARDAELEADLRERFAAYGRMPESNLRQAMVVPSAQALPNPIGSAPGWWVDRDGIVTVLLPGVPAEMRLMWSDEAAPRVAARFMLRPLHSRTIKTFGIGESAAAEAVGDLLEDPGEGVSAGIYARDDGVHLRFSTRDDPGVLDEPAARAIEALGDHVWGQDDEDLAGVGLRALGAAGAGTVASWEADTGGALLAILANAAVNPRTARFVGGVLDAGGATVAPVADAAIHLSLMAVDAHGRSRVRVSVSGIVAMPRSELRIHGSGPQRRRRAAFAALDQVRRAFR